MNKPAGLPTYEQLLVMSKEELARLLLLAMQGQQATTENMAATTRLLSEASTRIRELEDKLTSQEVELIALRNRP